ncbi:MAG: protein kinase [Deinococcota bacterium]
MPQVGETWLHYDLLDVLGQGAMGQVFKAKDSRLDRDVALKFLLTPNRVKGDLKARFVQEAKAVARLDHPHIGALYAIEEHQEHLFLAMAYYRGHSLTSKIKDGLELADALGIFKDLLTGFQYAHEQGVIHHDIKADNIFITENGTVKILDFGLARLPDSNLTQAGQMMGTPSYMSPEQFKGEAVDARSDIWSLGVLLFYMLTGDLPFEGKFPQIIQLILKDDPRPLTQWLEQPELQTIIERCLAKDKQERFDSCANLLAAIESLDINPTQTHKYAATQRLAAQHPEAQPSTDNHQQLSSSPSSSRASRSRKRGVSLVGRDHELEDLVRLVANEDNYLVTLVGIGGAGKTTLARAVMNDTRLKALFPDGRVFVGLDSLSDASQIPHAIAQAIQLQIVGQDPWESLHYLLAEQQVLLVLDNLEHLIDACAAELDDLLQVCSKLSVLATSRVVLNLEGEVIYDLKGLRVPETADADLLDYGATALFISRAKRLKRSFNAQDHEQAIVDICTKLEGWPLGIELAVAWIRQLSPREIAQKITESLAFLTTRTRHQASRHQSARAAFEYSWRLLDEQAQEALTKLAVFKGGFTTEAAFEVTNTSLETLALLVDASFLTITDEGRYDRHPLIDQFSQDIFDEYALADNVNRDFISYFEEKIDEADDKLDSEERATAVQFFEDELENLQEVLAYYLEQDETEPGLRFVSTLNNFWDRTYLELAHKWNKAFLDKSSPDTQARASCLLTLGELESDFGNYNEAFENYNVVASIAEELDNRRLKVAISSYLGGLHIVRCDLQAARLELTKGVNLARQLNLDYWVLFMQGNLAGIDELQGEYQRAKDVMSRLLEAAREENRLDKVARSTSSIGNTETYLGDFLPAQALFEESLELARSILNSDAEMLTLTHYGNHHLVLGNYEQAFSTLKKAYDYYSRIQHKRYLVGVTRLMALLAVVQQNPETVNTWLRESIQLSSSMSHYWELEETINHTALFMVQQQNFTEAICLIAATAQFRQDHEYVQFPFEAGLTQDALAEAKSHVPSSIFEGLWEEGQQFSLEQAVELALRHVSTP